jgi:D-alanine-D-alanine ligase
MNILLIAGGWSSEREVSLSGGEGVRKALEALGHSVTVHDPARSLDGLPEAARNKDFAFINLHGSPGEDGLIQAMLELLGLPYQGAGPAASMLALNKAAAKALFRSAGLNTAPCVLLNEKPEKDWTPGLAYPLFIKANTGGSSLHMERVEQRQDLPDALDRLFALHDSFLVECAVNGREITCGVLGRLENGAEIPEALPPILIRPATGDIFDYASKYSPGGAEELCPAPISAELTGRIQRMALTAHRALGIAGYSRSDFIVPENGEPVLLEVNTLPGMTPTSLIPQEAAAVGLSYEALVRRLIDLGMARHAPRGCGNRKA